MEVFCPGLLVIILLVSFIFIFLLFVARNAVVAFMLAWYWNEENVWQWLEKQIKNKGDGTTVRFKSLFVQHEIVVTTSPSNIDYIYNNNANFCRPNYCSHIFSEELHQEPDVPIISSLCLGEDLSFVELSVNLIQKLVNERLLPFLQDKYENSSVVNVRDVLFSLGFNYIYLTAMGKDSKCLLLPAFSNHIAKAFDESFNYHKILASALFYYEPLWSFYCIVNNSKRRCKKAVKTVYSFASNIVEAATRNCNNVLSTFIKAQGSSMEFMCINLILACKDTPTHGLCNLFRLLSKHPNVEDKIFTEVREILERRSNSNCCNVYSMLANSEICFTVNELKKMTYLEASLRETMRLYPLFPADCREVINDDVLPDGSVVKGGSKVLCFVYGANRSERMWGEEALTFKPERWMDVDNSINVNKGKFQAWNCCQYSVWNELSLGSDLSYMGMKAVAANIVVRYHVEVEDDESITVKDGLPVILHSRVDNLQVAF